jgi:N-acetylneuraminate synthase
MAVYIIAEAGSNWRCGTEKRDMAMAKALIDIAAESGADAVKFQTYRPESVYVKNAGSSDYLSDSGITEDIQSIFSDLAMPYSMIPKLSEYCKKKGIDFMSTPFSIKDAEAIDPFVRQHKLASYEISHAPLIQFLAKTGKPLIMSTGAATHDDIKWAVEYFKSCGGTTLTLMQCTAKYPAPLSTLNLNVLCELKSTYNLDVGLSDHSRDPVIGPLGAVALGAKVVEKHFTLHNRLPGPDHSFAICPDELELMVQSIKKMETSLGNYKKNVQNEEIELREFAQRSIQATSDIKKGELLKLGENMEILRSGKQTKGAHPKNLNKINGRKAKLDIKAGFGINNEDVE